MLKRLTTSRVAQVAKAYGQSQAGNYASGLALNAFLAMFPLILGILSIVGLIIHDPATQQRVYSGLASLFPADAHAAVSAALSSVRHNAGILGVVSLVGLVWSGSSLFASMEFALTKVYGTTQRDMLRQRAMGVVMMLIFVLAVVLSVTANSAAAASPGGGVIGAVLGAVVLIALMAAIYRWVPNRTFSIREILPGAVLAGVCVELFSLVFPLYARVSHNFGTYGQQFGLFFMLATWLVFMSQFILLGAVFNKVRLGAPHDEGLLASSAATSRQHTDPAHAIAGQQQAREIATGGQPERAAAAAASVPGTGAPARREARTALGLWASAAVVNTLVSRIRATARR